MWFKRSFIIYLCCQIIYSVMETNHLNSNMVISGFKLSYYIHFQANTLSKYMDPFTPPSMGWITPLQFSYKDGFCIK